MVEETKFLYLMFWTILAMVMALIYAIHRLILVQKHMRNMDYNIEILVEKILKEEDQILKKLSGKKKYK